jgi:hypothetical protein
MSDHQVGAKLLEDYVFIHLGGARDKLNLLLHMVHKLYALVGGDLPALWLLRLLMPCPAGASCLLARMARGCMEMLQTAMMYG